jgi:hypothetical protein
MDMTESAPKEPPLPPEQVIGVSWPRSGHGMLKRLLELYYGHGFRYCEFYRDDIECCRQFPCTQGKHFTKNHDWELDLPQLSDRRYLIQYRSFIPSVVSNFELHVRGGGEDSETGFRRFASREFGRYRGFTRKWVTSDFVRDQLILKYEDVLADPEGEFVRTVAFFDPDTPVDAARVAEAVRNVASEQITAAEIRREARAGVRGERKVEDFRYYDPALFDQLARLALTREEVIEGFQAVLGRRPEEAAIIPHQVQPTPAALEKVLRASDEYRAKARREAGPLQRFVGRLLGSG